MIEFKVEEMGNREGQIETKEVELQRRNSEIDKKMFDIRRKEKDLKKKEDEILTMTDQYNNNFTDAISNTTAISKRRRIKFNVEYLKNNINVTHRVCVKASNFDDVLKKIAQEIDVPNTNFSLAFKKKGNKYIILTDLFDLISNITWPVRLQWDNH